jgi:uncharacterized protein YndB with AHSA1/START domain
VKATASIVIPRSVEDVFAFVTDVATMPGWVTGVRRAHLVSPRMGPDARYVVEYAGGWRSYELEAAVTVYDPPSRFGSETARGPFSFEFRFEFEPVADGTQVTSLVEPDQESLSTRIAMVLFGPLIRRSMKKRHLGELTALSAAIQGTAAAQ